MIIPLSFLFLCMGWAYMYSQNFESSINNIVLTNLKGNMSRCISCILYSHCFTDNNVHIFWFVRFCTMQMCIYDKSCIHLLPLISLATLISGFVWNLSYHSNIHILPFKGTIYHILIQISKSYGTIEIFHP